MHLQPTRALDPSTSGFLRMVITYLCIGESSASVSHRNDRAPASCAHEALVRQEVGHGFARPKPAVADLHDGYGCCATTVSKALQLHARQVEAVEVTVYVHESVVHSYMRAAKKRNAPS